MKTDDSREILLRGERLSKRFTDKDRQIDALSEVDVFLRRGEFLGVVGESGSGKSTLLKVISGLLPVDAGEIYWRGRWGKGSR